MAGLYIHIPFCVSKCNYCSFYSKTVQKGELLEFTNLLCKEIELWNNRLGKIELETVYFGGGTPSLLPPFLLGKILSSIHSNFAPLEDCEITMEVNPESADKRGYLAGAAATGINRLSIGVQSFDNEKLALLGRIHSRSQAINVIEAAHKADFKNISLDLIWALPGQRVQDWLAELRRALRLEPRHLSCYALSIEPDSTWGRNSDPEVEKNIPDDDDQARMYVLGSELLESEGILQYEISNYARIGFASRHNSAYWEGLPYLGIGPGAVSTLNRRRWKNPKYAEWAQKVKNQSLGDNFEELTDTILRREMVMLALRTSKGLGLDKYKNETSQNFLTGKMGLIKALRDNGLIRIGNNFLRLTKNGMLVSDAIIARLMD